MLTHDKMVHTGGWLFRWRSYVLLAFLPFIVLSVFQGERVEAAIGHVFGEMFEVASLLLIILGEGIRILTVGYVPKGTSGRNTAGQIAETLNTTGAYSLTRNPLYLGNCLMYVGIALWTQNITLALILGLVLALYYERIIAAEEAFLRPRFGKAYTDWAAQTPAFFPRLTGYVPPAMEFSVKSVVRREHASIFGAIVMVYLIEVGLHLTDTSEGPLGWPVHALFALCVLAEVATVLTKRRTRLLDVAGR